MSNSERKRETLDSVQKLGRLEPLVRGHLFKQDSQRRSVRKRYFVLYEGLLLYYTHEKDYENDRDRGMKRCKLIKLDGLYLTRPSPQDMAIYVKHSIVLHAPNDFNKRNAILLVAANRKAMNIWIELLQAQNPCLLPATREDTRSKPAYIQILRYSFRQKPAAPGPSDKGRKFRSQSATTSSNYPPVWPSAVATPPSAPSSLKRSRSF